MSDPAGAPASRRGPVTDREVYPALWAALGLLAAGYLLWRFPLGRPTVSACWFYSRFHIYCPGCGGTRCAQTQTVCPGCGGQARLCAGADCPYALCPDCGSWQCSPRQDRCGGAGCHRGGRR